MRLVRDVIQLLARRVARRAAPALSAASAAEARAIETLSLMLGDRLARLRARPAMSTRACLVAAERAVDEWIARQADRLRRMPDTMAHGWQMVRAAPLEAHVRSMGNATASASRVVAQTAQSMARKVGVQAPQRPMAFSLVALSAAGLALAAFSPMERLAIGDGVVTDEGQSLAISHPEGGVIETVAVFAGQEVSAGDLLFRLEPSAAGGDTAALRQRAARLAMTKARLIALLDASEPDFSSDVELDPRWARLERDRYRAEKARLNRTVALLDRQAKQARARIDETERLADALRIALAAAQRNDAIGSALRSDFAAARLHAQLALVYRAQEAARVSLAQAETERADRLTLQRRSWTADLERVTVALEDLDGALLRLADRDADFEVRAPAGGRVLWIASAETGARVGAGQALMAILPSDAEVLAEVWTPSTQARQVKAGDVARVQITSPGVADGQRLEGIVKELGPEPPPNAQTTALRRVLVALNPGETGGPAPLRAVQPGVGVRAEIVVSQAPGIARFAGFLPGAAIARDLTTVD